MAFTDWRSLKKIDAHVHILPDEVHAANPDSEDVWLCTDLHQYRAMMDGLHIEKAVIMPLNDPRLMSMEFTVDAVHRNLRDMKRKYPGRFYAFADVDTRSAPVRSADAILPDYVRAFGIEKTEEILRSFGAERLLFATDYPESRHLPPGAIYDSYFDILGRMSFSEEEAERIAYRNAEEILGGKGTRWTRKNC